MRRATSALSVLIAVGVVVGVWLLGGPSSLEGRPVDALLPLVLVAGSLFAASRHGWAAAGGVLVALTAPVWYSVAAISPSGLMVAGGLALWVAVANGARDRPRHDWQPSRLDLGLIAAGWAALVVPDDDGLIFGSLALGLAILIFDIGLGHFRTRVPVWLWLVLGATTVAALARAVTSSEPSAGARVASVLTPIVAFGGRWLWRRIELRAGRRGTVAAGCVGVGVALVTALGVMSLRDDGFVSSVMRRTISQTGIDLREIISVFDATMPESMVLLWLIGLGMLVAAAVLAPRRRALIGATAILGVGMLMSWVLTMLENDPTGMYWQGRFSLPLLVGVPIVLSTASIDRAASARLARAAGAISLVVLNAGFAAALRHWDISDVDSVLPWDWDAVDTVVPPIVLLGVHVGATVGLWLSVGAVASPHDQVLRELDPLRTDTNARSGHPFGVNLLGYHQSVSGLGVAVRQLRASLESAGVPVSVFEVEATDSPQTKGNDAVVGGPVHSTTLAVVTAPELPAALAAHPDLRAVDRVVGYWFWELADVPDSHRAAYDLIDEIWAPTSFVADAYRRSAGAPSVAVQPMHLGQPVVAADRVAAARARLAPNDEFTFLVSLDLFSVVERKNPFGAIDAFAQAANGDGTSRLVIKTLNGDKRPAALQRIVDHVAASGVADRIEIIDEFVGDDDMSALLTAADCFVSLHRGEGLGLHLADAMWLNTPVLATRWSGNLDFMDDANSLLVDADLVGVTAGEGAYPGGMRWAEPDIEQASVAMRRLVEEPELSRSITRRARGSMAILPDSARCGSAYAATLERPIGDPAEAVGDFNEILHELRTRALATMPPGAARMLSVGCAGSWYFDWVTDAYGPVTEHVGIEFFSPKPDDLPSYATWIADTASDMSSIADGSADLLFSGQNIEHLWPSDVVGFLAESNRVLRDGGTIVVDSPNRPITERLSWSHPEHTIEFTPAEIDELFEIAGFTVTRRLGLWDCGGSDLLEAASMCEVRRRSRPVGPGCIDDAFAWWFEGTRAGDCDIERLRERVETIFAVAWTERMQRRVVDGRAVHTGSVDVLGAIGLPAGDSGVLVRGPDAPLSAGAYTVAFEVVVEGDRGEQVGSCSVFAGNECLGTVELVADGAEEARCVEIDFALTEMTFGIQGRIEASGSGRLGAAPLFAFSPNRPVGH